MGWTNITAATDHALQLLEGEKTVAKLNSGR
jgi:hypothetical protein